MIMSSIARDSDPVRTESQPECQGSVDSLLAGAGLTPIFTWLPVCRLGALVVTRAADDTLMWYIESSRFNLGSGTRYGSDPPG